MLFKKSLGVEIRDEKICLVLLNRGFKGFKIENYSVYSIEKEKPLKEKIIFASNIIKEFTNENDIEALDIYIGIPRNIGIIRDIELPSITKENLKSTLSYEIENYVSIPLDEVYFDFQIINEDKDTITVLLVAVKKNDISPYFDLKDLLGVPISGIELSSTAIFNFFIKTDESLDKNGWLIVFENFDKNFEITIIKNNLFTYSTLTDCIEKKEGVCEFLINEIKKINNSFFKKQGNLKLKLFKKDKPENLINDFQKNGIEAFLPKNENSWIFSQGLTAAFGLALRGIEKTPSNVNLLPENLRKKPSKTAEYTMIILVLFVLISLLSWMGSNILRKNITLNQLNSEIQRLSSEVADINRIQRDIEIIEKEITNINNLLNKKISILNILKELTDKIPETAWIENLNLNDDKIQIDGYAKSASALIPLLDASPLFVDVSFISAITKDGGGNERFRIGMKLKQN
ncbi:MAG: pilus assembly protein PilM [Desulfobacterales bacterium]|nr:pilus assembly protein PilM [Desulfobacterales bacterium]